MGDISESNMETDVSSTTGDVLDSQEVTGSQENMETVIVVVEQMNNDEELDSQNSEKPSGTTEAISEGETNTTTNLSDKDESLRQESSQKAAATPIKETEKLLEDTKEVSQLLVNQPDTQMQISEEQQSETVDSSSNVDLQDASENDSLQILMESSPKENNSPTKSKESNAELTSPSKEVESQGSTNDPTLSNTQEEKSSVTDKVDSTDKSKKEEVANVKTPTPMDICIEIEASNDSQVDASSDASEKEHNKSISRELKSLIKSAKESKIISECTQVTTKMRKSRTHLDTSTSSLNTSLDAEKIQGQRRASSNSQQSNSSEKSEKVMKRSMRSQNPEFVIKVKQFLNSVTGKVLKETEAGTQSDQETPTKQTEGPIVPPIMKNLTEELIPTDGRLRMDPFCWRCHWGVDQDPNEKGHTPMHCTVCPRSFHYKCLSLSERSKIGSDINWVCPECRLIMQAESSESRSPSMKKISLGMLCELLTYALDRMKDVNGVEPFTQAVDRTVFPDYDKYVVHPMDLSIMKKNIKDGHYGSTEAFHADAQWILHNSIIFNTLHSKLTAAARALLRSCKTEMGEIEACPECYSGAHSRKPTWFIDVCATPHILLWAKLKGFPHWPAKGMTVNSSGLVDVRFFGAHDRAWVPSRDCFLYSEKDPNNFRAKRQDIIDSMQEAEQHIRNISRKYGKFVYPPFKMQFEPSKLVEQLKMMIPNYQPDASTTNIPSLAASPSIIKKFRKPSKTPSHDEESNEKDDNANATKDKTEHLDSSLDIKNKSVEIEIEVESPLAAKKRRQSEPRESTNAAKENDKSRKRRRSQLEEAVITVIETASEPKRKKVEEKTTENRNTPELRSKDQDKQTKSTDNNTSTPKSKAKESPSIKKTLISKTPKINPLRIVISTKNRTPKITSPKFTLEKLGNKEKEKSKTNETEKEKQSTPKLKKKKSKSVDDSTKTPEQKSDKQNTPKHTGKGICVPVRIISKPNTPSSEEAKSKANSTDSPKTKNKDDETSLAELARESARKNPGLPTISSVRSLSDAVSNGSKPKRSSSKTLIEVTVEAPSNSSVFTPTSTDSVKTSEEAANKLQRLRDKEPDPASLIGKVGVRSFARMKSPPAQNDQVQVEVKSEPIDVDLDADRQSQKMDLMNAFRLRPVNPPVSSAANTSVTNLREVRITKVAPPPAKKATTKELRPRAKKSFPQPKKPDDGRSELTNKNSMVYIPIQPPMSQAPPPRASRPTQNGPVVSAPRTVSGTNTSVSPANNLVNTVTTPLVPSPLTLPASSSSLLQPSPSIAQSIGQVPANVHTVPLLTTMNGQWTISLQPIMSVGGVDNSSPTLVNGVPDRSAPTQSLVPIAPNIPNLPNQNMLSTTAANQNILQVAAANQAIMPNNMMNAAGEMARVQRVVATPQEVPVPSSAGPLTAKINMNAAKMADLFRSLLEESIDKVDDPTATVTALKLQLEHAGWKHKQEIDELKHTHELQLSEVRLSMEKEKARAITEVKRAIQGEIDAVKSKRWCAQCKKEAQLYCCWSAAYCEEACQRAHWTAHHAHCEQNYRQGNNEVNSEQDIRMQPKLHFPKHPSTSTPMMTVGGKMVNQDKTSPQKSAIIMGLVEDPNGNQTVKCVGYQHVKQSPPVLINKQIMATDEQSKKVVTSGGYLIVGTGASNSPLVTQTLRPFYT